MSVYARYKKDPEGLRKLVELLETTPSVRRKKMIDVGMTEDPEYTQKAVELMLNFEDVMKLPDMELAEVIAHAPSGRTVAYAIKPFAKDIHDRFLRNSQPRMAAEIKDLLQVDIGKSEIGAAQLKMIEITRSVERKGLVKTKRIPTT